MWSQNGDVLSGKDVLIACSVLDAMHSKSSHHKKHKKDKKKHKHRHSRSDEGSKHHHKKRKRKHAETEEHSAATADVIYIDDGAHSVKQLRLDDDNSLQVICIIVMTLYHSHHVPSMRQNYVEDSFV